MTPRERLVTVPEGTSIDEARELMHTYKVERVLVLNEKDELKGLITIKDILKPPSFPMPTKTPKAVCASVRQSAPAATPTSASKPWSKPART